MSFIDRYFIKIFAKKVGVDHIGNEYFIGIRMDFLNRRKRYVLYKGMNESTKIPPLWHAWLHYLIDELPTDKDSEKKLVWQKDPIPNLSGTKFAYDPSESRSKKIKLYKPWQSK